MTRLRSARKARNFTQTDLARLLDCDQTAVSLWERGKTRPHRRHHAPLEKLLGAPVADLLKNDDERPQAPVLTPVGPAKDTKDGRHEA